MIHVCIAAIGANCRNLKNLALAEMCYFVPVESYQMDPSLFAQLRALELWAVVGVHLPNSVAKQLLASCLSIQNLLFRNCNELTEELLNELWAVRHFILRSRSIPKQSIAAIVTLLCILRDLTRTAKCLGGSLTFYTPLRR